MFANSGVLRRAFTTTETVSFAGTLALAVTLVRAEEGKGKVAYLTDMSRCTPSSALSRESKKGRWQLVPYETTEPKPGSGMMIGAASFVDAPEVRLRLGVAGWHRVHVGFWNPHYAYDDGMTIKVKLSGDPCFTRITEAEPGLDYNATCLKEALFKVADLTGRDLVFGKLHGPFAQKAYIAYVKLVSLSAEEVAALEADRAREDTRVVQATIDGISYFWSNEYRTKEHVLELVERYRHSDVGKVIWAVNYGDVTNYPSRAGVFWAQELGVPIAATPGNNSYIAGEKTAHDSLRKLVTEGVIPEAVAVQHVHQMGLKFDVMFRLAILGSIPPMRAGDRGFVRMHPEFRQVMADSTPVEKASYAFPEVREKMLSIIRETAQTFDIDGANLCFVRGPHFMSYEKPVLDDFQKGYGEDGKKVGFGDPRMRKIRCSYLTEFVRDARKTLDGIGKRKGKRLELSAWIPRTWGYCLDCGFDIETWMKEGLVDSLIIHGGPLEAHMVAAIKAYHCKVIYFPAGGNWAKEASAGVEAGVDGFAFWDMDTVQDYPQHWAMLSRLGHREDREALAQQPPAVTSIRLKTVGGFDVLQGLGAAVYSGG